MKQKLLEKKITGRKNMLTRFVGFVTKILRDLDKIKLVHQGGSHTHTRGKMEGLCGFDFEGDFQQTSQGGNDVTIWYKKKKVMCVSWQAVSFDPEDCRVELFDENPPWYGQLIRLSNNPSPSIEKWKSQQQPQKKTSVSLPENLLTEAKRLAISA